MSKQRTQEFPQDNARRGVEMLGFLVVSALGIFALGNGLTGLFEAGKSINLLWLAVSLAAMMILWSQMRRVKDTWPRRRATPTAHVQHTIDAETAPSAVSGEER